MHEDIVNNIVFNAFNGLGDSTGDDEFGVSVAWIDLCDYLEDYTGGGRDCYKLTEEALAYNGGQRYAIAQISSYGNRDVVGFDSREEMMRVYHSFEDAYLKFHEDDEEL